MSDREMRVPVQLVDGDPTGTWVPLERAERAEEAERRAVRAREDEADRRMATLVKLEYAELEVKRLRELVQEAAKLIMVFRVDQTLSVHEIDPLLERLRAELREGQERLAL